MRRCALITLPYSANRVRLRQSHVLTLAPAGMASNEQVEVTRMSANARTIAIRDLQGIAGKSIEEIEGLGLPALDSPA